MPRSAPNFIWHKSATDLWIGEHEAALGEQTGGTHAIVEVPGTKRRRVEFFCGTRRIAEVLQAEFGGSIRELPVDWEADWFSAHRTKALRIGRRLVVMSDPTDVPNPRVLVIPAGLAFGTGEHATTAMSLRLIERLSRPLAPGWGMLDAGTGSGILALAGARFGAGEVVAIDNDPRAVETARENGRANRLTRISFVVGDITRMPKGKFEIITANLYVELLQKVLPRFARALTETGWLILSGVLRSQERELARALQQNAFRITETRRRGKWVALAARVAVQRQKRC